MHLSLRLFVMTVLSVAVSDEISVAATFSYVASESSPIRQIVVGRPLDDTGNIPDPPVFTSQSQAFGQFSSSLSNAGNDASQSSLLGPDVIAARGQTSVEGDPFSRAHAALRL